MAPVDILRTALVGAALANGTAAMAWVKMCNGRSDTVMAAFALADKGAPGSSVSHPGVTVEGWWKLAPGECATVSEADARQGFLYFHATSSAGRL